MRELAQDEQKSVNGGLSGSGQMVPDPPLPYPKIWNPVREIEEFINKLFGTKK